MIENKFAASQFHHSLAVSVAVWIAERCGSHTKSRLFIRHRAVLLVTHGRYGSEEEAKSDPLNLAGNYFSKKKKKRFTALSRWSSAI